MSRLDPIRTRVGNRIRARRRALGMTQQQAADLSRLPRLAFTRIELGIRRMTLPDLAAICDVLGCSAEELLGDAGLASAARRNHERLYGLTDAHS
ncbi:MAG TPA: helix-turn-helix transcriptional regulator [Stellaceae bacterium]|nr:helix-turn-helix transcriptional regulator [Stellaceae bacterium]